MAGITGRLAALSVAAGAALAVVALTPRRTGSANFEDVIGAWGELHQRGATVEERRTSPTHRFASMLLSSSAVEVDAANNPVPASGPPPQALRDAAKLATYRGRWTRWSAILIGAGVVLTVT